MAILDRSIWEKFKQQPFVLEVDREAGRLVIEEPRIGRYDPDHRVNVNVTAVSLAVDWDRLLSPRGRLSSGAGSDAEKVIDEVLERLWDAAMTTGPAGHYLEWRDGYFNAVAEPHPRWSRPHDPGEGEWVVDDT